MKETNARDARLIQIGCLWKCKLLLKKKDNVLPSRKSTVGGALDLDDEKTAKIPNGILFLL